MIADTGPLVAWLDRADPCHEWATSLERSHAFPWLTCEGCLAEAAYRLRAPEKVAALVVERAVEVIGFEVEDWRRIYGLAGKYADHAIDLVDFCIVRLSEKFPRQKVAVVDRRDFEVLRRFQRERLPLLLPPRR